LPCWLDKSLLRIVGRELGDGMSDGLAARSMLDARWVRRALMALGLVGAVYGLLTVAAFTPVNMNIIVPGRPNTSLGVCTADHFCRVIKVAAGLHDAADVRPGDQIRFDRPLDRVRHAFRTFVGDESVGATLRRNGVDRHVMIVMPPRLWTGGNTALQTSNNILSATTAVTILIGVLLLVRAGNRNSSLLLGASLIFSSMPVTGIPFWWWLDPLAYGTFNALQDAAGAAGAVMFLGFAREFRRETSSGGGALDRWLFWVLAALSTGCMVLTELFVQDGLLLPLGALDTGGLTPWSWVSTVLADSCYIAAIVVLAIGRAAAPIPERSRYNYIIPAVFLIVFVLIFNNLAAVTGGWDPTRNPLVFAMDVLPAAGLLLLAYAVLRHRVIDIGFAINRTVVYGVVSAILLAAFGLIEWSVDHLLPIEGREKNALVDAVIAVGVFLAFHRVRDAVEHFVENVFFQGWQRAEANLRRFVREAAFFSEKGALIQAFVGALSDYTDDAPVAVYLLDQHNYRRASGAMWHAPDLIPFDTSALVSLRADPKRMEVSDQSLSAAMLAPMLYRNQVIGFAMFGQKPHGRDFRPDEIELIGWATLQVGLDLHALEVEQLAAEKFELRQEVSLLNAKLDLALGSFNPRA
jgi:hypothetical protein